MYREGLAELNERITGARAAQARFEHTERMLATARDAAETLDARLTELGAIVKREQKDVDRLEGSGLTALFYRVLGSKEDKLVKERQELVAATLKYDEANAEAEALAAEIGELEATRQSLAGAADEIARLLGEKERWLQTHGGPAADDLFAMTEELGRLDELLREIDEAIEHGQAALAGLGEVLQSLSSASNWGTFDMLGGGLIATIAKHSKIDSAKKQMADAQHLLSRFERELKDVKMQIESAIEIGQFATFADFFFDGLIADWVVQSRIKQSRESVEQVVTEVSGVLDQLTAQRAEVSSRRDEVAGKRAEMIDKWA